MPIRLICVLLLILSWISVNIYLPALPLLTHIFHTKEIHLKLSLTLFLGFFALSQLIWGPLSEKYGRKKPLLGGMAITSLGVLITLLSQTVFEFNLGRSIEAIGLGCAPVLGRAILTDAFEKAVLSVTLTYATIVANMMPALAPIIGGHLMLWFGWRTIFLFLLIYSLTILFLSHYFLPESHKSIRATLNLKEIFLDYAQACRNKEFVGYLIPYLFINGAMIGYYTFTPFLFIKQLKIHAENFGFYSLITVSTYIVGAFISKLFTSHGPMKLVLIGTYLAFFAGIGSLLCAYYFSLNVITVLLPIALFTFAGGFISPGSNAGALSAIQALAGIGSAVIGASIYAASAIFSTIATSLSTQSLWPLAIYISLSALIAFLGYFFTIVYSQQILHKQYHK